MVQIAFQSLGSLALDAFDSDVFGIGKIRAVRALGVWLRRKAYLADTTSIRVTPPSGPVVTASLTLCAAEAKHPVVELVGEHGNVTFEYTLDDVVFHDKEGLQHRQHFARIDLLENIISYRQRHTPLRVSLRSTGAFMRVVEAVRTGGEPFHIERKWVEVRDEGMDQYPVIEDVEKWIRVAADADSLFSEVGAPWAFIKRDTVLGKAEMDGIIVLEVLDGSAWRRLHLLDLISIQSER